MQEAWLRGTIATLMSTELNSLANNTNVEASGAYTNTSEYTRAEVELVVTFGTSPTVGTGIAVWFKRRIDGTNYEDGAAGTTPARAPDLVLPVRNVTTAQRVILTCMLPPGEFLTLARNDATGQTLAASGNTLKIRPLTFEAV
jgi:hypothetical protein